MDCHRFSDARDDLKGHVGFNPEIVGEIIHNDKYEGIRNQLTDEATLALHTEQNYGNDLGTPYDERGMISNPDLIARNKDRLILLSICGAGRHRSVANTNTLRYCLEKTEWPNVQEIHLDQPWLQNRGCQKSNRTPPCRICDPERSKYERA